jgi:TonB-dependent receptor
VYESEADPVTGAAIPARWWGAPRSAVRTFSSLSETSRHAQSSLRLTSGSPGREFAVKLGGAYRRTHRDADSRAYDIYNLLLDETDRAREAEQIFDGAFASQGALNLRINANGGRYQATDENLAAFGQLEIPVAAGVRVLAGARVERARLEVNSLSPAGVPTAARLDDTDVLPALSLNLALAESQNLRLSVSQTLSRPEYRELSPTSYFEVLGGLTVFGNPALQRALIQNADLRWEWFPNPGEVVSVGAFAKRFQDPIELVIIATTGGTALSYVNAEAAHNFGVELEVRKTLADLGEALSPFSVFGNVTLMRSRITPGNDSVSALTSENRPMVGQASYVVNGGLSYTHPRSDISATLLYNVVGRRIAEAGVYPMPDAYEQPRHVLDAALRFPLWGGVSMKVDAKNLLDAPYQTLQGTLVRQEYRVGRTLSFGLSWRPTS